MAEPALAKQTFDRMVEYDETMERGPSPVFVGRQPELDRLVAAVHVAADNPYAGTLRVVQGVAGAGKTSLRRRLLDSISGLEVGSPGNAKRAFGVEMYGDDLNLPPLRLVAKITEQLPPPALQDHLAVKEVTSVGSQILARRSIYELTDANHGLNEESDLATCLDVYALRHWAKDVAVVLAFDEMQKCLPSQRAIDAANTLSERGSSKACVTTMCFGLLNTGRVLEEGLKLSRIPPDAVIDLCMLRQGEGEAVIERTLDYLRLSDENPQWLGYARSAGFGTRDHPWPAWRRKLVAMLAERTSDFPQHLTAAMRAICSTLVEHGSSYSPENDLMAPIAELLERHKSRYYDGVLGSTLRYHSAAIGAFVAAVQANGSTRTSMAKLADALAVADDFGDPVERRTAKDLAKQALARGLFQEVEYGALYIRPSAIPSMCAYLVARFREMEGDGHPAAAALTDALGIDAIRQAEAAKS